MAYKCLDCGHIFDDGEEKRISESRGEFWGFPAYETYSVCPMCGGDFEETKRCKICGSEHLPDEMTDGVCDECANDLKFDYKYNPKKCYELSENREKKESVSINGFLACMFSEDEINEILLKELVSASAVACVDCAPFIECDFDWFIENAVKEV